QCAGVLRQNLGSGVAAVPQPNTLSHEPANCAGILQRAIVPGRDGGTGRRSGLKIRRPLRSWGFDPPSRHQQNKEFRLNWPLEIGEAKIVWWLFWWLLVSTVAMCDELRGAGSEGASGTEDCCFQTWVKTPSEILINLRKAGLMLS